MIKRGDIQENEQVVVISTAHGLKFTEFKIGYHEDSLKEVTSRYNNSPVELPPDLDLINKVINKAT
jgi:threonine synthase